MTEIEAEGKTAEEAIHEGLKKLGVSRESVDVKILNEGTTGLFGLMGTKPARVRLTLKAEASGEEGAAESTADLALAQQRVREILTEILKHMNVKVQEISTALIAGRIMADIKTDEGSLIIGKNGQTLEALEHVLNLILNKEPDTRVKVVLDTEKYRQRQEERLQVMAKKAAEQVKRTEKVYRFDPMPSRDRRVIHLFLKSDPDVETFSEGEGQFRKVGVKLKNK